MQDDSWLADREGRLRPEVARLLSEARLDPVPPRPRALVEQLLDFADRNAWALLIGCVIILAVPFVMVVVEHLDHSPEFESRVLVASSVTVDGGPGNKTVVRLPAGEAVEVLQVDGAWCRILTQSGTEGWLFAGVIGRAKGPWLGPGYVVESISFDHDGENRTVPAGSFVLIKQKEKDHRIPLFLPDGTAIEAPAEDVLALEKVR